MSKSSLIRWGGIAAVVAGVLIAVSAIVSNMPFVISDTHLEIIYVLGGISTLFGLLGIYGFQTETSKVIGFLGFVVALSGAALLVAPGGNVAGVDLDGPATSLMGAGFILLAIGSWIADRLPRWIPALWVFSLLIATPSFLAEELSFLIVVSGVLFGLSLIGSGVKLWADASAVAG